MTASSLQTYSSCRRAAAERRSGGAVERAIALLREWRRRPGSSTSSMWSSRTLIADPPWAREDLVSE